MTFPDLNNKSESELKKEAMALMNAINSGKASTEDTLRLKKIYDILVELEEKEKGQKSDWRVH